MLEGDAAGREEGTSQHEITLHVSVSSAPPGIVPANQVTCIHAPEDRVSTSSDVTWLTLTSAKCN